MSEEGHSDAVEGAEGVAPQGVGDVEGMTAGMDMGEAAAPPEFPAEQAAAEQAAAEQAAAEQAAAEQAAAEQAAAQAEQAGPATDPMAEEEPKPKKRRKIDLKSRLSSVRSTASIAGSFAGADQASDPLAFPPPPSTGSVPAPRLPGGISAPMVSSPFAPPEPEKKPTAQQQVIKVDAEDIQAARKKTSKKVAIYVAIAAIAAGAAGFLLGMTRERGAAGYRAIEGANGLATDIEAANKTMSDLSDTLRTAGESLGNEEYPDSLLEALKSMNVDFDASKFKGRSVGGLPAEVFNQLLTYTNGVDKLNTQKDTLRNLLGKAKGTVTKYWKEKKKPEVKFGILFGKQNKQMVAEFVPLKEPFEAKGDWPAKITVVQPAGKGKTKETEVGRFNGKGKIGSDKLVLPVAPKSVAGFTDITVIYKLRKALDDTRALIDGKESPIPDQQTDGLLKGGKHLIEGMKKISQQGG